MAIPKTRVELIDQLEVSYSKLRRELDDAGTAVAGLPCVDDWTVKDLLAVRLWWTERVVDWVEAGRAGDVPVTPAQGYKWTETPRLNADVVARSSRIAYKTVCRRLEAGYARVVDCIAALDDSELLEAGVFEWAGKWPVSRWFSINTVRQYTTARTKIRAALRARG